MKQVAIHVSSLLFSLAIGALGLYACFHDHPVAGGWLIFASVSTALNLI